MQAPSLPIPGIASQWTDLIARLPPGLDLDQSARSSGALRRRRNVQDAETLLRLALAHGPGALSLRSAAAWAGLTGVAQLSDVALRRRLRGASDWLGHIAGALLSRRSATAEILPASRMRIVDGTSVSRAGDHGTTWRIHASFDPATACFTDLQLTGAAGGEGFSRFSFVPGELAVGDRFYAKPPGLQHVLRSGADFLVRVGWNSMRMVTANGARLDLASIYARMAPGETSEVPVFITGRNKGQGRKPRRLFPARLIVFRQHEEASARAVRAAKRQHSKKRSDMALQPMTLASARFLMVLTSLPADKATAVEALAAYRLRWQVELAFKRLKSGLGIDRLLARDATMARSWLLSHLILALLIEDDASEVLDSPPCKGRCPRSACFPMATTSSLAVCASRCRIGLVRDRRAAASRWFHYTTHLRSAAAASLPGDARTIAPATRAAASPSITSRVRPWMWSGLL